jgi:hypothetical protein
VVATACARDGVRVGDDDEHWWIVMTFSVARGKQTENTNLLDEIELKD